MDKYSHVNSQKSIDKQTWEQVIKEHKTDSDTSKTLDVLAHFQIFSDL